MDWYRALEAAEKIATIGALIAGAGWAYFHYFKRRTYASRLELSIVGELFPRDDGEYLRLTASLKNDGLSRLPIEQAGTGIRVLTVHAASPSARGADVERRWLTTLPVFQTHRWIEPGESLREQFLVAAVRSGQAGVLIELRVVSRGLEWNTMAVVVSE